MEVKNIVRYHCTLCMWFQSCDYFKYTEHLRSHHIQFNENLHCSNCQLYFKFLIDFVNHMYTKHMYRSFDCVCGLEFDSMCGLENHVKYCKNLNQEVCKSCKKTICYCVW